ncbi:MAG: acetylxylan esterase [Pirellulaceae bacterium]
MFSAIRPALAATCWRVMGILAVTVLAAAAVARGAPADETAIGTWLAKPILGADTAQREVERFCEAKVAALPAVANREAWEAYAHRLRNEVLDRVVLRGEARQWADRPTRIEWLDTMDGGEGYRIRKLRYEAVPGLWIPALLYEPSKLSGRVAVALNVNGHDAQGKAAAYKQIRCINQAKRGMMALNLEWLGMGQLRGDGYVHYCMNQLDLCGTSGLAPFYLAMKRGLDVLLTHPHADPARVAVTGLSGGGWQTIVISALDPRVTLANPVAGYSSYRTRLAHHSDLGDSEQTPTDLAAVADYAHLTALLAPRPALLTYNAKDNCCFAAGHALAPLLEAATPIYGLYDKKASLQSHVNEDPGTHNFEIDNRQALYRMLGKHFFADQADYSATEIACESELKTE